MASINGSYINPPWYKCSVFVWEITLIYYFLVGKISPPVGLSCFTTWRLPEGFELQYVDYAKTWGISRDDETNYPFRTNYVNSVYCRKGPLYWVLSLVMRREAALLRDIARWYHLDTEREKRRSI